MDFYSKEHIANQDLDKRKVDGDGRETCMYRICCEDIDHRYKLEYGSLEIRPRKEHEDPMGLHGCLWLTRKRQGGRPM